MPNGAVNGIYFMSKNKTKLTLFALDFDKHSSFWRHSPFFI